MPTTMMAAHDPNQKTQREESHSVQDLFHAVPAGILYLNSKLIIQSANKKFLQTLGSQADAIIGNHIRTVIQDAEVLQAIENALNECKPVVLYSDNFGHDQRVLWQWSINPVGENHTHAEGVLVQLIEVTGQFAGQANQAQTEARLHNIVHSAPLLLCVVDKSGQILVCEGKELEKLGFDADHLIGRSIFDVIPHRKDIRTLIERALSGESFQTELATSKGDVYAVHFQAYKNAQQEIVGVICNAVNITDNKKFERELQRSEERFRTTIENMHDPFILLGAVRDEGGQVIDFLFNYANHAALTALGVTPQQLLGRRLLDVMPNHIKYGLFEQYRRVIETGEPVILEDRYFEDTIGDHVISGFFDIRTTRLEDQLALTWRNVTERKLYHDELVRQQRLLETVLEALPVGIWLLDSKGNILKSNPAGREIWGGETFNRRKDGDQLNGFDPNLPLSSQSCPIALAINFGKSSLNEIIEIETLDGVRKTIQNSTIPIRDSNDIITGAVVVDQDITQLKRIETELIEVKHQLQMSIETERMKLAKDLHDGPLQTLLAASYMLEDHNGTAVNSTAVSEAQEIILNVIDRLREIYGKLRPATVAHYGLFKAMRFLLTEFHQRNPHLKIYQEFEDEPALTELTRQILFRIFKHLLDNIEKHSKATTISVKTRTEGHWIIVEVSDNGSGFSLPERWVDFAYGGHFGLLEAKESIEAIGGYLVIDSTPNEGTHVHLFARCGC